jgi:peptide/nickel transport system substrate-binding protein
LDGNGIPSDFFADVRVRKAFNFLMPYEKFNEQILNGYAFRIQGPLSSTFPANSDDNPMYHYNREKAVELLKEAHDGKLWEEGFKFTGVHNAGNYLAKSAMEMLASELRDINPKFRMEIHASTWNEFIPLRTAEKIPFFYSGWGGEPAAFLTLSEYLSSDGYFNPYIPGLAELCEEHADPVFAEAIKTFDLKARSELMKEVIEFSYDYATHLYLTEEAVRMVHRDEVDGWYFSQVVPGINMPGIDFYALSKSE